MKDHPPSVDQKTRSELDQWLKQPNPIHSIHYACESFYYKEPPTRIAAIAVKNKQTNESRVFSVFDYTQEHNIAESAFSADGELYNVVEHGLIHAFYKYAEGLGLTHSRWVHWNMSSDQYGFAHIENRYRKLGGEPMAIAAHLRLDLSATLHSIYGPQYVCDPKLPNLARINHLIGQDFIPGDREAFAFMAGRWQDIHRSAKEKASLILEIADLAASAKLMIHDNGPSLSPRPSPTTKLDQVLRLCERFHKVANWLRRDYRQGHKGFLIDDEYDVQHLLHSILLTTVDDVRPEEWSPTFASKAARVDFVLPSEKIAIEAKKTRSTLTDKEIGDEIAIDLAHYKGLGVDDLICLIYDPEHLLRNPVGLKRDLEALSTPVLNIHAIIVQV